MKSQFLAILALAFVLSCSSSDDSSPTETNDPTGEMMNGGFNVMFSGDFTSAAHPTTGLAEINQEETILRLTNFHTDEGPSLEVYLATDTSASTYISLGAIQGVDGDYQYNLPGNVDYSIYNHVIIWCVPFSVNFGYAILQ